MQFARRLRYAFTLTFPNETRTMGGFSIWHWVIVLLVVVLLFGTKKLRNAGSDLGSAIRSFRKGLQEDDAPDTLEKDAVDDSKAKNEPAARDERD